jgi:transposase-like protein
LTQTYKTWQQAATLLELAESFVNPFIQLFDRKEMICPHCGAENDHRKNGIIHNGKPKLQCNTCTRQFVQQSARKTISGEVKTITERLILLNVPIAIIAVATGISVSWLQKQKRKIKEESQCLKYRM